MDKNPWLLEHNFLILTEAALRIFETSMASPTASPTNWPPEINSSTKKSQYRSSRKWDEIILCQLIKAPDRQKGAADVPIVTVLSWKTSILLLGSDQQ